jgi:hypothetical protein
MKKLVWPEFPRVEELDSQILIIFEDGKTQVWGKEDDPNEREFVIKDIQEGLRAIKFLSGSLREFLDSLYAVLNERGFSGDQQVEYVSDAIRSFFIEQRGINIKLESPVKHHSSLFYIH